jgi:hypothetical protein
MQPPEDWADAVAATIVASSITSRAILFLGAYKEKRSKGRIGQLCRIVRPLGSGIIRPETGGKHATTL